MNIITIPFEEPLVISIQDEIVELIAFQTPEHGNIKFGVKAPRKINVHREEIYLAIKQKNKITEEQDMTHE